jgi:hypothetical protein
LLSAPAKLHGQEATPAVTEKTAHELAESTLTAEARQFSGMRFDREQGPHVAGFYWFEVTADVPDGASPLLGYFAVNKVTGDVWAPVPCEKLTSPEIRRLQRRLRGQADAKDFHEASKRAPCPP